MLPLYLCSCFAYLSVCQVCLSAVCLLVFLYRTVCLVYVSVCSSICLDCLYVLPVLSCLPIVCLSCVAVYSVVCLICMSACLVFPSLGLSVLFACLSVWLSFFLFAYRSVRLSLAVGRCVSCMSCLRFVCFFVYGLCVSSLGLPVFPPTCFIYADMLTAGLSASNRLAWKIYQIFCSYISEFVWFPLLITDWLETVSAGLVETLL